MRNPKAPEKIPTHSHKMVVPKIIVQGETPAERRAHALKQIEQMKTDPDNLELPGSPTASAAGQLKDLVESDETSGGESESDDGPYVPIRRLYEMAKSLGAPVVNQYSRDHLVEAIMQVGGNPHEEFTRPENAADYWSVTSRFIGTGPISMTDPAGWFSAELHQDGSAKITRYASPNLHNRPSGKVMGNDQTIDITNFQEFVVRMVLALEEGDSIFEDNALQVECNRKQVENQQEQDAYGQAIDPRVTAMRGMCKEFGFVGPHTPTDNRLPYLLAQALGIDPNHNVETGEDAQGDPIFVSEEKAWDKLADEILIAANPKGKK